MEKINSREQIYTIMYCLGIFTFILIEWYLVVFYPLILLIIIIILGILFVLVVCILPVLIWIKEKVKR